MHSAQRHPQEDQRLKQLYDLNILDTPAEQQYDELVALAAAICGVPIAAVTLVDQSRQWFKAKVGWDVEESSREVSFCAHGILDNVLFEVPDALDDVRFADNPLVQGAPNIRFYAGFPLRTTSGLPLGSLCVIDREPRKLNDMQRETLRVLSQQVSMQLELRLANKKLTHNHEALDTAHDRLKHFFKIIAHDLRSPFNGLLGITELLERDFESFAIDDIRDLLATLHDSASETFLMLENLLEWSNLETGALPFTPKALGAHSLAEEAIRILAPAIRSKEIDLKIEIEPEIVIQGDATMLASVIRNLTSNAIKFTPKYGTISIQTVADATGVQFVITDNGVGMNSEQIEAVQSNTSRTSSHGTNGERGSGIGLQLIHQFLAKHEARLEVESHLSKGTTVRFSIPARSTALA
ncbi:MAG: signal transduction histidine kinase [Lentimonas sp.]|jgi:signal transduction histidine kinase